MSDLAGALFMMTLFSLACLVVATIEQHKLEKQRREREEQLLIEQRERELEANAIARYEQAKKEEMRQSLANWMPIQFKERKPKPNRKYGVRNA